MTARRTVFLAAYWLAVLTTAAIAATVASIPFTGLPAQGIGLLVTATVCLGGIAYSPTHRKGRRS